MTGTNQRPTATTCPFLGAGSGDRLGGLGTATDTDPSDVPANEREASGATAATRTDAEQNGTAGDSGPDTPKWAHGGAAKE